MKLLKKITLLALLTASGLQAVDGGWQSEEGDLDPSQTAGLQASFGDPSLKQPTHSAPQAQPATQAHHGAQGSTALDNAIRFITMEKGHKQAWIQLKRDFTAKKFEVGLHIFNECADFKLEKLNALKSRGFSDELVNEFLNKAIALHKKHKEQLRKLFQEQHEKCKALYEKNKQELAAFEQTLQK